MRIWHFYDEKTGVFTRDSIGGQDFKGIENWVAANLKTRKGVQAIETTGISIRGKKVDLATGKIIDGRTS